MKIAPSPGIMIRHITFLNKDCILCIFPAHQGFKRTKLSEDGYESAEALMVSEKNPETKWIMDSGCSWHMTPNRSWFEQFSDQADGLVLLGDNKPCKIEGIGL